MKITIIQGAFLPVPPVLGGAVEKRWFAMGKEFVKMGHEVVHVSRLYADLPREEWIEGVHHKRVQGYGWCTSGLRLWLDFMYSQRTLAAVPLDSDIVITNSFWAPLVLPESLRRKCMVDVARIPKGQMRLYGQASRLRANSSPVADAIRNELPAHHHQRVVMIPNPLPFYDVQHVDLKAKKPIVLYTGRLTAEKGLDLLINACKDLAPGWKLQIIGPAEKKAGGGGIAYLQKLKRLAGNSPVEFIDPIYDAELLNRYYAEASIFVYPSVSERGESFGLAPLEAMAWGCVPIVSKIACFQDFIKHESNGVVFDHRGAAAVAALRTAVLRLINADGLRQKLAREALQVRNSHSTSCIATRFVQEFQELLDESKSLTTRLHESLLTRKTLQ